MTTESAAGVDFGLFILGVLVTFGVRTWVHRRATGSPGFHGLSGRPGSAAWSGGVLFRAALLLTAVVLVLATTDNVSRHRRRWKPENRASTEPGAVQSVGMLPAS